MSLNDVLKRKGMTQAELSRRTGIDTPTICKYCKGERVMRICNFARICEVLNMSMDELFEEIVRNDKT